MKEFRLTKKQHEKDSEIMGAIIAGVKASKKKLVKSLSAVETEQSLCAIGAANRGKNVTGPSDVLLRYDSPTSRKHQLIPLIRFSTINEVSENYGCGVNDGFEDGPVATQFWPEVDMNSLDYLRGYHVGQAVRIEAGY